MAEPAMEPVPENKPVLQDAITEPFQRPTTKGQRHGNSSDTRVSESFAVKQHMRKKIEETKDDVDIFSSGVAAKLRKIKNEHLKLLLQRDIDNLLYDALLGTGQYSNSGTPMPSPYSGSQHFSPGNYAPPPTCSGDSNLTVKTNNSN